MATTTLYQQAVMETTNRLAQRYPQHASTIARASELVLAGKVEKIEDGKFRVRSGSREQREYIVTADHCPCESFEYSGRGCKHQFAALAIYDVAEIRAAVLAEREQQSVLTEQERSRLTIWKMRYAMTNAGFSQQEAKRLIFARLRAQRNGETRDRQEVA